MKRYLPIFLLFIIGCASVGTVETPSGEVYTTRVTGNAKFKLKTEDFTAELERKPIVELKVPDINIKDIKLDD